MKHKTKMKYYFDLGCLN